MGIFHFLNVLEGDCSLIQHPSGRRTIIDVNNAYLEEESDKEAELRKSVMEVLRVRGNFNQKQHPVNPISYIQSFGVSSVFRFILTHPDMDHMGGLEKFFQVFDPTNFWDIDNTKEMDFDSDSPYNKDDWDFYTSIRDKNPESSPNRLVLYSNARGKFYNESSDGTSGGDGLYILSPTLDLINEANDSGDYNDASYVILYRSLGGTILFSGDSHDKTWENILDEHEDDVENIDLLIAPHHGRKSDRSYEFLDVVNPKLTFFGNARSENLAYDAWRTRDLQYITNNQANCMVVDADDTPMKLYVTHETYARSINPSTTFDEGLMAYYCYEII